MAKPPPPGYERHARDPNLIRKVQPKSAAAQIYPYLKSDAQHREEERLKELARRKERG
jgi:hypothetical protein